MATFTYINIGQFANDQTGDTLRTAFQKVNQNTSNLSILAGSFGNTSLANLLANSSVTANSNSLVIRDATGSGYFANVSSNNGIVIGPPAIVTANASPVIDLRTSGVQMINLTANIGYGNNTFLNANDGREYSFIILQPVGGAITWYWPSTFRGGGNIGASYLNANANSYSTQKFMYSGYYNTFFATNVLTTNN